MFSPLEQFEIIIYQPVYFGWFADISINNASVCLFVAILLFLSVFYVGISSSRLLPSLKQVLREQGFFFITSIIKEQAGNKGLKYFPLLFLVFFIVLFSNLIGLVPFFFTPTSHIFITFSIALTCNLAFILIGFAENGLSFFKLFFPKGSPLWLFPVIVAIEFVSYLLRTFSLSIRLFANMMAGHTLLHILSSFVTAFANIGYTFTALFPFILVLAVIGLELAIAFLQAYVFIILLCIYLNDAFHPSH